jgi:hypothetical protein
MGFAGSTPVAGKLQWFHMMRDVMRDVMLDLCKLANIT